MQDCDIPEILPTHAGQRHCPLSVNKPEAAGAIALQMKVSETPDCVESLPGFQNRCCQQKNMPDQAEIGPQDASDGDDEHD